MNNAMLYKIKTSADQAELNLIKVFFSYVDDFVYDGSTSKLMFVLKVPIGSVQLSLMPNTVDTYLQTVTVVFSDSPTYQTLTETGARLVATLLGGEVIGTTGF